MNSWLYPISKKSGYYFTDDKGHRARTSYESFRDFVVTGRIQDRGWWAHANFKKVAKGDEVFIYTGDKDRGIIAYAKVTEKTAGKARRVTIRFDQAKTKLLLADPVPAPNVRPLIPPPRAPLVNLKDGIRDIYKLLPWTAKYRAQSKVTLKALKLRPVRFTTVSIPKAIRRQWLRHDSVLQPVRIRLKSEGFQIGTRSFGRLRADLVAQHAPKVVIVEAKVIRKGAGREQGREGLGQLLEYSWLLARASKSPSRKHTLWLAFSAKPAPGVAEFLASHGLVISWPLKNRLKVLNAPLLKI
jgi:hypothetical protein